MPEQFDSLILNLQKLVQINSVESKALPDMPFGKGVFEALDFMLSLGKSFGFKTISYSNYIGEIVFEGKSEESFAILCHLDVVPAGDEDNWSFPPFGGVISDGKLYGRGTVDNKGAAVSVLYALKLLKDEGFIPTKTIKLILGCDEESGWECIKHYNKVAKMPEIGFSPDADFPVIYAEKGILHLEFQFDKSDSLTELCAGVAANVVCDKAFASAPIITETITKYGLTVKDGKIESYGKTAHASTPQNGENALVKLLKYLTEIKAVDNLAVSLLVDDILDLKTLCDHSGRLTLSPDMGAIKDGKLALIVDIRYPVTFSGDELLKRLGKVASFTVLEHQKPLCSDKNGFLVQTLLSVYNEFTKQNEQPIAIGGGTYARALKNGAAFGPSFIGKGATCHEKDEYISLEHLKFLLKVYKEAIYRLTK